MRFNLGRRKHPDRPMFRVMSVLVIKLEGPTSFQPPQQTPRLSLGRSKVISRRENTETYRAIVPAALKTMVDRGNLDMNKDLSFVDPRIRRQAPIDRVKLLPVEFRPQNWDVICSRGRQSYEHIGNRRFRICIENHLEKYAATKTKLERTLVIMGIVDTIRDSSTQNAGFVKQDGASGRWYEVGDKLAREKVGQALREAVRNRKKRYSKETESLADEEEDDDRKMPAKKSGSSRCDDSPSSSISSSSKGTKRRRAKAAHDTNTMGLAERGIFPITAAPSPLNLKRRAFSDEAERIVRAGVFNKKSSAPAIANTDQHTDELTELIGGSVDLLDLNSSSHSISSSIFSSSDDVERTSNQQPRSDANQTVSRPLSQHRQDMLQRNSRSMSLPYLFDGTISNISWQIPRSFSAPNDTVALTNSSLEPTPFQGMDFGNALWPDPINTSSTTPNVRIRHEVSRQPQPYFQSRSSLSAPEAKSDSSSGSFP